MPIPKPSGQETEQDFISRFMGDPAMAGDYPDQAQRAAVAFKTYRGNDASEDEVKELMLKILATPAKPVKNSGAQKGQAFPMRFIEPGLVHYSDVGTVLVKKETLDKMLQSFVGKPIFNEAHRDVTENDFSAGIADGVISRVWYEPKDGWFWADAIVWDDETKRNMKNGYSLSCAYDVTQWGTGGGIHNNIPYDREVLGGEYTHLAIVSNPRYEGAKIIYNQGGRMKLKFWEKDKKTEDAPSEVELTNSKLELDGKEVPLDAIISGYKAEEKRKAELANATKKVGLDDVIEVDGRKVSVKDLVGGYQAALKNQSDEDKAKKDKDDEERKNAEEKEKADKEAKDKEARENRKNDEDHEKGDHKEKEMENCLKCAGEKKRRNDKHFEDLKNAADRRDGEFKAPNLSSVEDKVAAGLKQYGPK